ARPALRPGALRLSRARGGERAGPFDKLRASSAYAHGPLPDGLPLRLLFLGGLQREPVPLAGRGHIRGHAPGAALAGGPLPGRGDLDAALRRRLAPALALGAMALPPSPPAPLPE